MQYYSCVLEWLLRQKNTVRYIFGFQIYKKISTTIKITFSKQPVSHPQFNKATVGSSFLKRFIQIAFGDSPYLLTLK